MKKIIDKVVDFSNFLGKTSNNLHSAKLTNKSDINEIINYLVHIEKTLSDYSNEIREEGITINKLSDFVRKTRFEIIDILEQLHDDEAIVKTKEVFILLEEYIEKFKQRIDKMVDEWNHEINETFDEEKIKKG